MTLLSSPFHAHLNSPKGMKRNRIGIFRWSSADACMYAHERVYAVCAHVCDACMYILLLVAGKSVATVAGRSRPPPPHMTFRSARNSGSVERTLGNAGNTYDHFPLVSSAFSCPCFFPSFSRIYPTTSISTST